MRQMLRPEQCAELAQLCEATIRRKCQSGEIKASKPAGQWRIHPDAFERWLTDCEPEAAVIRPRSRLRASENPLRALSGGAR